MRALEINPKQTDVRKRTRKGEGFGDGFGHNNLEDFYIAQVYVNTQVRNSLSYISNPSVKEKYSRNKSWATKATCNAGVVVGVRACVSLAPRDTATGLRRGKPPSVYIRHIHSGVHASLVVGHTYISLCT